MPAPKRTDHFFKLMETHLQVFLQKSSLSINLFLKNELFNHAGAAAFYFLLSVTPVFLLLLIGFDRYLTSYPDFSTTFFTFLKSVNENLDKDFFIKIGLLNVDTTAIGIFGLLSLLWAGRSILTSIQRGLGIIFPAEESRPAHVMNTFSFVFLSFLLLLAVLATFISMGFNFVQTILPNSQIVQLLFKTLLYTTRRLLPFFMTFLVIFLIYRFMPSQKPKTGSSLIAALFCSLSIILIHTVISKFFSFSKYNVIYGFFGSVILIVLWVHFSFVLFFFFAEFAFVSDRIDILLLERFYFFKFIYDEKGKKVQKFLFSHPKLIFEKYAKRYMPGDILFREGDKNKDIYFIYRGTVGIYHNSHENKQKVATLGEGEVFGEMAYLLNENRTATAVAETESIIMIVVPDIFEELLQSNHLFSRKLIEVLSDRIRKTQHWKKL
ncbi:MAG: YihY/virulence factor BrkB family protein [Desulfobacterales bacterium]|nr:MAG: YihY/virulence factor BrkB family protein [Desulfobacterales bacterium]